MKVTKNYPKYKIAGQAWLGQIPDHWEVKKIKYLFSIRKDIAGKLGYSVLSITQGGIKIKDIDSGVGQLAMDYSKYQLIAVGDFAMNQMDLITGYVDISKYNGVISPDYRVFRLTDKKSLDRYFLYLLQYCYHDRIFYALGQGSSQLGRWRLAAEEFNMFEFPCPTWEEQNAIVNFLNCKTEKIKKFIGLKERTIELLKERKAAIINQVVTKGLNADVEMKDSGIDWLGMVPKLWGITRLKDICHVNPSRGLSISLIRQNEDVVFLPMEQVKENGTFSNSIKRPYGEVSKGFTFFERGDVLLAKITPCFENGKGAFLNSLETSIGFGSTEFHVLRPKKSNVSAEFISYLVRTYAFMRIGEENMIGSAGQKRIPTEFVSNFRVALPRPKEQSEIIKFIKSESQKIDEMISKTEKEIDLVLCWQKSLIHEAVTGKIDVRGAAVSDQTLSYSHHEV